MSNILVYGPIAIVVSCGLFSFTAALGAGWAFGTQIIYHIFW